MGVAGEQRPGVHKLLSTALPAEAFLLCTIAGAVCICQKFGSAAVGDKSDLRLNLKCVRGTYYEERERWLASWSP